MEKIKRKLNFMDSGPYASLGFIYPSKAMRQELSIDNAVAHIFYCASRKTGTVYKAFMPYHGSNALASWSLGPDEFLADMELYNRRIDAEDFKAFLKRVKRALGELK